MFQKIRKWILKEKLAQQKQTAAWKIMVDAELLRAGVAGDLDNYKLNTDYLQKKTGQVEKMKTDLEGMTGDAYQRQMDDITAGNAEIASIDERNNAVMNGRKDVKNNWIEPSIELRRRGIVMMQGEANKLIAEAKKIRQAKI